MLLLKLFLPFLLAVAITACGGGGGGSDPVSSEPPASSGDPGSALLLQGGFSAVDTPSNNQSLTSCLATTAVAGNSTLTGRVYYQRVPLNAFGLDYNTVAQLPMRGLVVEAVDASGGDCSERVLATTLSNGNGEYGLNVPENQAVCVQVRAQLYRDGANGGASWNIQITDNTNGNAPYYLLDATVATPADQPERDLLAAAGVEPGSSNYTQPRAAASFAILDTLCEAINTMISVDSDIELPVLAVRWSELNNTAEIENGNSIEQGDIGGSFYRQQLFTRGAEIISSTHEIFLLGDEDSNTDEYDPHVITHEFGHYLTASFARFDAIGGEHAIGDHLDLRLAFEEGWADAVSGITLDNAAAALVDDPAIYRNSFGENQSRASRFPLQARGRSVAGWYSEASVASIIYNLFDSSNDSVDDISLGFAPIFNVLRSSAYQSSDSVVSLYTFVNRLKQQRPEDIAIDALVADQDTETVIDDFGSDEDVSNNDIFGGQDVAAVYTELALNTSVEVCSNNQYGNVNKLSVSQFLILDADINKNYRFEIRPVTGVDGGGRAVAFVYKRGELLTSQQAVADGSALVFSTALQGRHIVTLAHTDYLAGEDDLVGRRCFSVLVE